MSEATESNENNWNNSNNSNENENEPIDFHDIHIFNDLIRGNRIKKVKKVLDAGFDVNISEEEHGDTPLMVASEYNRLEIVKELLDRGADIDAQDTNGNTALIISSRIESNLAIVKELLDRGANVDIQNGEGKTALIVTVYMDNNHIPIVNELCLHGADVNIRDNNAKDALYYAVFMRHSEIVRILCIRGAILNAKDATGKTHLMEAVKLRDEDIVLELVQGGADVNIADNDGITALMLACQYRNVVILDILCTNGANVNAKKNNGITCLVYVCREGNKEFANILLENGADPNLAVKDVNDVGVNMTPIMGAAYSNSDTIIKALIAAGGNINETEKGATALMLASRLGNFEAVVALCEGGADKSLRAADGKSAAEYAKTDEIREYLINGKITEKMWKGMTQSDMTKLNTIFEDSAINYSTCPVCLEYVERSEACMYMKHDCSKGPYYNKKFYDKYKSDEGKITWCTICGRICHGHRHYKLHINMFSPIAPTMPPLAEAGDPFATDCKGQGGGGLVEKLSRFRELRKTVLQLEEFIDNKSMKEVMNLLIIKVWNAPMWNTTTRKEVLRKMLTNKKWNANTRNELFRANVVANTNANAPNIPFEGELPVQKVGRNNIMFNEDVPIFSFRHKQRNGSIEEHGIAQETLEEFLKRIVKEFGTPEFGLCFMNPACDAKLHPDEIRGAVPEELYKEYKKKFNKKFRAQGGGGGIFREATDAVCVVPKRRTNTKNNKKKGRRTRRAYG